MTSRLLKLKEAAGIPPRLLSKGQAAAYCGVSVPVFVSECPVIPIKLRTRVLYDRVAIDRWLDARAPGYPESDPRKLWLGKLDDAHAPKGH